VIYVHSGFEGDPRLPEAAAMRAGVISVYVDPNRRGEDHRGPLQPQIGPLIAALLPADVDVELVFDTWREPDWTRSYDLLFISCLHSDFDRARQISHYWRRRGAKTVFGGILASTYPALCRPFFDAIVVGDAEGAVPDIYRDFNAGRLKSLYVSSPYDPDRIPVPRLDLAVGQQLVPLTLEPESSTPQLRDFFDDGVGRALARPLPVRLPDRTKRAMFRAAANGLDRGPHVAARWKQVPPRREKFVRFDTTAVVEALKAIAIDVGEHPRPDAIAVARDDRVSAPEIESLLWIKRRVNTAEDDAGAARARQTADLVAA